MKPQREAIEASNRVLERLRNKKGRTVGSTEPVEMGGTGQAIDLGQIVGQKVGVEMAPGVEVKIGANARVVQTVDGSIIAVSGSEGQPVTVREARQISGEKVAIKIRRALSRNRKGRKEKLISTNS